MCWYSHAQAAHQQRWPPLLRLELRAFFGSVFRFLRISNFGVMSTDGYGVGGHGISEISHKLTPSFVFLRQALMSLELPI